MNAIIRHCKYNPSELADRECFECNAGLCSAGSCGYLDKDNNYYCNECWEEVTEAKGICPICEIELEPVYENNGFTAPDPTHYEIAGYKPCQECRERVDL